MPLAVVLLAAYVQLHEAIPPEIIQEPGGPVPVSQAFPGFAPEIIHIAKPGVDYVWSHVSDYVSSGWHAVTDVFGSVQSMTYDIVANIVDNAINMSQTAWSSMISHVRAYAATGMSSLFDLAMTTEGYFLEYTNFLQDQITWALGEIAGIEGWVDAKIWDAVQGIDATLQDMLDFGLGAVMGWAIDNILNPLLGDIDAVLGAIPDIVAGVYGGTIDALGSIVGALGDAINAEVLERIAGIAALTTTIASILTWLEECGVPMCDLIGPKTDFAKLWNAVKGLLAIAAGVELANITEADLERIAQAFASITSGSLESFVSSFVEGGATLAGAAGDIPGELGSVGAEVLGVLGVPGF